MRRAKLWNKQKSDFHLEKWFLDLVTNDGEAMIFYAAKLVWKGWTVPYTSWLHYHGSYQKGVKVKSRFRNIQMPQMSKEIIKWSDPQFDVAGQWKAAAPKLQARLFESEEGYLDWQCFQPISKVSLRVGDRLIKADGYAEKLILTAPPWKIPMDELRWGRIGNKKDYWVWIEIKEKELRQWLWWNGERVAHCSIGDSSISLPDFNLKLKFDRGVELEGERKIFKVVEDLMRFIPRFDKVMPLKFLMADEHKWLSKVQIQSNEGLKSNGHAIHELVEFNTLSK